MNAGIKPTDETLAKFNDFKMKKKIAALVFKIEKVNGAEKVVLDKEFPKDGFKQEDLIDALPTDEGRFVYLDFDYENDDGIKVYKIISILYCPITAKATKKMMYSTTYGSLNSDIGGGIQAEMQCDGPSELTREHILKRFKK
jgi:hypothetical protein